MATFASQRAQGIYALAGNYGGLVARLLLQPLEEISRNLFGKLLSSGDGAVTKESVLEARSILIMLLRSYVLLSVCIVSIGPTAAPLLLKIVAGSRWVDSGAGKVLATYCYYIPCLAINGLAEAFVSSAASESEVNRQTVWMFGFSAGFAGAAFVSLRILELGAEGLVWANVMNMLFRIIWCSSFIQAYLKRYDTSLEIGALMPRPTTIAAGVSTYAILARAQSKFHGGVADYLRIGAVAAAFVIILWVLSLMSSIY